MRKFYLYSLLTSLLLLCSTVASAHDFEVDGVYYNVLSEEDKTVAVTYSGSYYYAVSNEYTGAVVIPATVTHNNITYSVTSIGEYAFFYCTGLTGIEIPNSVTSIGGSAFLGCTDLTSIVVDAGNSVYDSHEGCNALIETATNTLIAGCKNTVIPNSVTSIGNSAFSGCTGLTSITIPNNVTSIGDYAFNGCTGLTGVAIPNSVTTIGKYAFYKCSGLTSVAIPNSVTTIGNYAFQYCDLREIHIPASVESFGDYAFTWNLNLQGITMDSGNKVYNIPANSNVIMRGDSVVFGWQGAVIPENAVAIGNGAFNSVKGITSITIPASVTSIGAWAFEACSDLTEIYCLSETPARVYSTTFQGLYDTVILYVPAIGKNEYAGVYYWEDFTNIVLVGEIVVDGLSYAVISEEEKTVQVIGYSGSNEFVKIPSSITKDGNTYSVTSIEDKAFYGCTGLTGIEIPNSVTTMGDYAFYNCTSLTSVTIPNSVTSIGDYAFNGCTGLTSVTIPNSVTSIGDYAFNGCTGLTSVTIPNSVTTIENSAFEGCTGLTSITIPNSVTSMGEGAFYNCTGLTGIEIPNSVTSMGDYAFYNCTGLTSVTIPNSVTSIGNSAFSNCTGLTSVTIPNSVTSIGNSAFSNCTGLTSIIVIRGNSVYDSREGCNAIIETATNTLIAGCKNTIIPGSVTSIGREAFIGCKGLTSVTIPNSVTSIENSAFEGCTGLTSVTIPNSVTSIENSAFSGCTNLKTVANNSSLNIVKGSTTNGYVAYYADKVINAPNGSIEGDYVFGVIDGVNTLCGYIGNNSTITLPENYKSENYVIGSNAFRSCSGLTSIEIPNSVTSIGSNAFYNCTGLTSVTIPNSVTTIGEDVFFGCRGLTAVHITDLSAWCKISFEYNRSNPLFYAKNLYLNGEKVTNLVIPSDITEIKESAFESCTGLTSVTIPNSVTTIENSAFEGCTGLTSVTIGNSVTSIEDKAFYRCRGLVKMYVKAITPPTIPSRLTFHNVLTDIPVYVPIGTKAAYQAASYWENFTNIVEMNFDLTGDVDGDGVIDVADATTLVSMILDNSLATDAADVDGDGTVDVADATALVSIILGTDTASAAPAKAAATRAGEISTVSADGDGSTLLININNPGYPFSAIQFDLELPEGIEVDFDGEYYAVDLGSRTNSRKHSYPECAIQPDGSLRVVIISMSNALYNGTTGDVATATLKVNGADDGDYQFTIKNVVLSAPGSKEKLEPYTGWINVTGGVTGISEIKEERAESNDIYDLQGRKVTEPVKGGIYIVNGKKVIW